MHLLLAVALPGVLSLASTAQSYRLNAPFEYESVVGDVQDFAVKPNGNFVFYRADARLAGVHELFTVPALGGVPPFRENGYMRLGRAVVQYQPSPAGNWVVFIADQDQDEVFELYSHKPSDAAPRKLSGALAAGREVLSFVIAPNGTRVVYCADQDANDVYELYSVPIDASTSPVKISGTMVAGGDVAQAFGSSYSVTPSSARVVYVADQQTDEMLELYSVPIDGSASPVKLNAPLPAGGDVTVSFGITPNGTTVVYRADQDADELYEAFRVPLDGSASPTQINATLVTGGDVFGVSLTPDGQRALYAGDLDANDVAEVYSAPLDGSSPPVKLNLPGQQTLAGPVAPDSSRMVLFAPAGIMSVPLDGSASPVLLDAYAALPGPVDALAISPDSSRLVYRTTQPDSCEGACVEWNSLRSVPLDGSAGSVRLDDPGGIAFNYNFEPATPFAFSADSSRVIYAWGDGTYDGLYSVPIDRSSAPTALALAPIGPQFAAAPVGTRVFFTADFSGTGARELHSVELTDGTGLVKLSGKLARDTFADVDLPFTNTLPHDFEADPSGQHVVYGADAHENGAFELFTVPADGQAPAVALDGQRNVDRFLTSPDGAHIVYRRLGEIYSVVASGGTPVKLNHALPAGRSVGEFQIDADGSRVVYLVAGSGAPLRLYSVAIDASTTPVQLEDDLSRFELGGPSHRAVYVVRSNGPTGTQEQLFSVPDDGSAAPVALGPVMPGVVSFAISADGSRVAFRGGSTLVPGSRSVFSAPVDGSAGPILLSGTLVGGSPLISPDCQWVLFQGEDEGTFVTRLFSARIDGTLGPLELNGPLVTGGGVVSVPRIGPDSSRVVYTADQDADDVFELYSVPIDASASPVKLNGALVSGGDVLLETSSSGASLFVQISPDGSRVLYLADQEADGVVELFSAPSDGSASPVELNGALVAGGDVGLFGYRISPDSSRVVYGADQETDGLQELYLVPLDGSRVPRKLDSWPLTGGGVQAFEITADSQRVVYQATMRPQVTELFASRLTFDTARPKIAERRL